MIIEGHGEHFYYRKKPDLSEKENEKSDF
jgi:hypothetical protein